MNDSWRTKQQVSRTLKTTPTTDVSEIARSTQDRIGKWVSLLHPAGIYRWLVRPCLDISRDLAMGVSTALPVRHRSLHFDLSVGTHYVPSNWKALTKILPTDEVASSDVFLDVGCGKGVVLGQAMQYPFSRIVGVDVSERLCEIARRNALKFRQRYSSHAAIDLFVADARDFQIPPDVTLVYMFHPFSDPVFSLFIDQILISLEASPRRLRLIYNNPVMHSVLVDKGFDLIRQITLFVRPVSIVNLYEMNTNP